MLAGFPLRRLIVMADDAVVLAGMDDRFAPDFFERSRTVVAVLAECLGNDGFANRQEDPDSREQGQGKSDKVPGIVQGLLHGACGTAIFIPY